MTFEEFAAGQLSEVLGFALVLTGDRASAEDIVQETLIRAHQHWDKIGGLDRPKFYIRKMVVNEFLSSRRRLGYSGFGITAITSNNCDSSAGPCPEIGLRIPVGFHGPATIEFGRAARPGERYAQVGPATAPGGPMHGMSYVCQNVSAVLAILREHHVSAVVRYPTATGGRLVFGADVQPGTWYVNEATLLAPGQVMLWVGSPCTPGLPGSAPGLPGAVTPQPAPSAAPIPSPAA
jgi:hypothetical protein